MTNLIPVIDHVLESLNRGHIKVFSADEVREVLMVLRSLALDGEREEHPLAYLKTAAEE